MITDDMFPMFVTTDDDKQILSHVYNNYDNLEYLCNALRHCFPYYMVQSLERKIENAIRGSSSLTYYLNDKFDCRIPYMDHIYNSGLRKHWIQLLLNYQPENQNQPASQSKERIGFKFGPGQVAKVRNRDL